MRRVLNKAMNKDYTKRFQNADDFSDAIGRVPYGLDWSMMPGADGGATWRASRERHASIEVDLIKNAGTFSVEVYTVSPDNRMRRRPSELWGKKLSAAEAQTHLVSVFRQLP